MDEFMNRFDPNDEYESIDDISKNNVTRQPQCSYTTPDSHNACDNANAPHQTQQVKPENKYNVHNPYPYGDMPQYPQYKPPYYQQNRNVPPYQAPAPMQMPAPQYTYSQVMPNPYVQPKSKNTGLIVFVSILTGLLILFSLFFANNLTNAKKEAHPLTQKSSIENKEYTGHYIDTKIVLQDDTGQAYITKNSDNIYPADKNAKSLKTKDAPKDKDDKKYTTENVYVEVKDSVVCITCYDNKADEDGLLGSGTGTIVTKNGYIVTNSHVINNSAEYEIKVKLANSKEYKAKVVGLDSRTDIAVLKIDAKDLKPASFANSDKLRIGQDIIAIGNPGGDEHQNSLTKGVVSGLDVRLALSNSVKYIQLDAAINPGNSGGPLCNIYGQVVGINTAKVSDVVYEGMGFAIPSNKTLEIANDLIKYGYVRDRVRLGLTGYELDSIATSQNNLPVGIVIEQIDENGPLADTDIAQGDIITEIDGEKVETFTDIFEILDKHKADDEITITVYRIDL